jgi:hypothetical protein
VTALDYLEATQSIAEANEKTAGIIDEMESGEDGVDV